MTDKKTTKTEKQPRTEQPEELKDDELDKAHGGGGSVQGLVAHELTHATDANFNPKEFSVDRVTGAKLRAKGSPRLL